MRWNSIQGVVCPLNNLSYRNFIFLHSHEIPTHVFRVSISVEPGKTSSSHKALFFSRSNSIKDSPANIPSRTRDDTLVRLQKYTSTWLEAVFVAFVSGTVCFVYVFVIFDWSLLCVHRVGLPFVSLHRILYFLSCILCFITWTCYE